ncbi:MAG: DUF11 domain-containing protein [Anaerolineae bacterium]|nr:DUF11 domain-containing protein [Anaerolineae bacterium]
MTYADLRASGFVIDTVDPRTFQLHNQGEEAAIYVSGEQDGTFDPGDHILFYGQKMDSRYTDTNIYWLTWGEADGQRMAEVDGSPTDAPVPPFFHTTQHVEENHLYQSRYASGTGGDHWYWTRVIAFSSTSYDYDVMLHHVATALYSATVRGLLYGVSVSPSDVNSHHIRLYLNGRLVDDFFWPAAGEYVFEVVVPQAYVVEGRNVVTLVIPLDAGRTSELFYINWFEVDYYARYIAEGEQMAFDGDAAGEWTYRLDDFSIGAVDVFDISQPLNPSRILSGTIEPGAEGYTYSFTHAITAEHRYLALTCWLSPLDVEAAAPVDLRAPTNGADYIVITHSDFYTTVQPLADYRAGQGLRTIVVDVQDIYDVFNAGIFDPEAIRDFLSYAYGNWVRPAPTYVLLVGDGNYDFKNYGGHNELNFIPPYLIDIDLWVGEVPSDNRYVCVSGDDVLPDMHVGRLPVKTSVEAATVVGKILSYEQSPPAGDWNQNVLFIADNADDGGNFAQYSDELINNYLPSPYESERVYLGITHPYEDPSHSAHAAIVDGINDGSLVVNYIGHAVPTFWAAEHLFQTADIPGLSNEGRLPLVVTMACLDGYFVTPSDSTQDLSSTAERMVLAPNGGAIASWSATGMGYAGVQHLLNEGLLEALFYDDVFQLGPATLQARHYLYSQSTAGRDQIEEYTLFGDPALTLHVPAVDLRIVQSADPASVLHPGDSITYTLTYSNAGPATARHVIITDLLPSALVSPVVTFSGAAIAWQVDHRFTWDVADLAEGEGGVITITAVVDVSFAGLFANTMVIDTTAVDADAANNTAVQWILVGESTYLPLIMKIFPVLAQNSIRLASEPQ